MTKTCKKKKKEKEKVEKIINKEHSRNLPLIKFCYKQRVNINISKAT